MADMFMAAINMFRVRLGQPQDDPPPRPFGVPVAKGLTTALAMFAGAVPAVRLETVSRCACVRGCCTEWWSF